MAYNGQQRIGIVGGMGPMAGVLLQKLIIEATPALRDQDHLQVICFTNPQIPDRTLSLQNDSGASYLEAVIETANILVRSGATRLVIPCNTSHARFSDLQNVISVPIINMIEVTAQAVAQECGENIRIGILATDGTINGGLYQKAFESRSIQCSVPSKEDQAKIMQTIYAIKAGEDISLIASCGEAIHNLMHSGAHYILLGCTELSLYFEEIQKAGFSVIDPLRIVARHVLEVSYHWQKSSEKITTENLIAGGCSSYYKNINYVSLKRGGGDATAAS
jgi:aspartate racemase